MGTADIEIQVTGHICCEIRAVPEVSSLSSGVVQNIARSGTPAARNSACLVSPFMVRSTSYFSNAMPTSTQDICHEK